MNAPLTDEDDPMADIRRHREELWARFGGDRKRLAEYYETVALDWPGGYVTYDEKAPNYNGGKVVGRKEE